MKKSPQILVVLFVLGVGLYSAYAAGSFLLTGNYGVAVSPGVFRSDGNAGTVVLMSDAELTNAGIPGVTLEPDNTLTGNLWLQTVGYVHLGHNTQGNQVRIIPPAGGTNNLVIPWEVQGNAWSENAGWIAFDKQGTTTYPGVYFIPATGSFTGIAWSETLGYIDFSQGGGGTSENGLIGRVKVLGNAGGLGSFDSAFVSNNGVMKTSSVLTPFMNTLHKNVALLTRNTKLDGVNRVQLGNLIYYKLSGTSIALSAEPDFCKTDDSPRSIIVEGGDILINRDVTGSKKSCAIIALSSSTNSGNIYISEVPEKIDSYLIAEGSVFSGLNSNNLYNASKALLAALPQNQLYIRGGVISRNTIGGAFNVASSSCPYTESTCDYDKAIKYDLNFFRNYTKKTPRAYKDDSLNDFSVIIEYDSRSAGDPPPGF
ncbi:hypothetical protein KBD33_03985 [Candidatus Gracilibacteria bacterium]|nr:hypothetical protein [Candidatus Gracilibacteria bacterium]